MQGCGEMEHLANTKWLDEQDSQRHPGSVQTWSSVTFGQKIDGDHIERKLPQQKSTFTNSTVERWWSFSGERSANSWTCFHDLPSHHQAVILFMLILSGVLTILLNGIVLYVGLTSTKLVLCLLIIWSRYFYFYPPRICLSSSKKTNNLAVQSDPPPSGTFLIQPCWVWPSWTFSPVLLPRQSSRWSTTTTVRI